MKNIFGLLLIAIVLFPSCAKKKNKDNLLALWTITEFTLDGIVQWDPNVTIQLEFMNIENGEGEVREYYYLFGSEHVNEGVFSINNDYSHIIVNMVTSSGSETWDVDINIGESQLILDGVTTITQFSTTTVYSFHKEANK